MAKHVLDYDPLRGVTCHFNYDHALGKVIISHTQDVSAVQEFTKNLQKDDDYTRHGMKNDLLHYAIVPAVIQMEMKEKHGVDFWDTRQSGRVFALLNDEYSDFKVTSIKHNTRR